MGWWSATVLGGDEPMDYVGDMEDLIGLASYDDEESDEDVEFTVKQRRAAVNKNINRLVKYAKGRDSEIAFHVLGAVVITNGAKLSAKVRTLVVDAIKADEWANAGSDDSTERKFYMAKFLRQINRYPLNTNTRPRTLPYEGLFDKLAKMMAGEK